jgi:hypothetical protein
MRKRKDPKDCEKTQERRTVSMRRIIYDEMNKLAEARGLSLASEVDRLLVREIETAGIELPPLIVRKKRNRRVALNPVVEVALAEFNRGIRRATMPKVSVPEPMRERITLPRAPGSDVAPAYDPPRPMCSLIGAVQSQHIEF